jgi:DNA recombination protein RmuC
MGFRTLAIGKRSSEVWQLLGAVKTEFGKFGQVLAKTKKKLKEAGHTIDQAEIRSRAIERKLKNVQDLSLTENAAISDHQQSSGNEDDPSEGPEPSFAGDR